jgi:hypothetical protein
LEQAPGRKHGAAIARDLAGHDRLLDLARTVRSVIEQDGDGVAPTTGLPA